MYKGGVFMYELIKKLCATKGISPTKLCTEITGSKGNLPTWQKGNINPVSLTKIADYFNVSTDYLLGRTDEPQKIQINSSNIVSGDNGNNSPLTVNGTSQQDEMSQELLKRFQQLSFEQKIEVMSLIVKLSQKAG